MKREYRRWHSPSLGRDMELLIFGHAGAKVLVFPTRDGRFWEYEERGMLASLAGKIEAGLIQLVCVDGLAEETFYAASRPPVERIRRYQAFEAYILNEVMPMMAERNPHDCTIAHGCSLGAFQALNLAFRHPHRFRKLVAFSGRYDLTLKVEFFDDLLAGHYDDDVYFNTPTHFLPGLDGGFYLDHLRRMEIVLVIGSEDPFLDNNLHLGRLLREKAIPYSLHIWEGRAHKSRYWRQMAPLYV
ncbi:esterase family protein [Ensifer soli]|uniref:esterase family protein n=1 Tax=Ciceribacter sp. sgz301302 TaxID=3342379 RepID=UPI0035B928BE